MGTGPLVLYAVTALAPLLIADLGVSRTELGAVAAVTFLTAAVCAGLTGPVVDRSSERVMTTTVLLGSAAALLITGAARDLAWLLVAGAVAGAAQSLSNPVTNRLISTARPTESQGLLVGLKQSGVQLSQLVAGALLPAIAVAFGWRVAMFCATALAVAGLPLVRNTIHPSITARGGEYGTSGRHLPDAGILWLFGYTFLTASALQATNVYLPLFTHQDFGLDARTAGLTAALAGGVGAVSRVFWARRAGQRDTVRPLLLSLTVAAAAATALLAMAGLWDLPWLVWPATFVHGSTALASNAVVIVAVIRTARSSTIATASGLLAFALYLGFAVGPLSFGLAVDTSGSYAGAWLVTAGIHCAAFLVILTWSASVRIREFQLSYRHLEGDSDATGTEQ